MTTALFAQLTFDLQNGIEPRISEKKENSYWFWRSGKCADFGYIVLVEFI